MACSGVLSDKTIFYLALHFKKGGFTMKAKSFKKFFASIALSAVLTFSTAATAFAATAQLIAGTNSLLNYLRNKRIPLLLMIPTRRLQVLLILPLRLESHRLPLLKVL